MFKYSTISGPVAVAGLTLMLALGACSSGGDGPPATDTTDVTPEPMPEPAPPTDLETTQAAAMAAADAAKMASDAATAAATGAMSATAKRATLQTGEMAGMHAMAASDAADTAMAEYLKAKAASEAAAAATLASAAGVAQANAEAAQKAAEAAQKAAEAAAMKATEAAGMELMIDDKDKSVGESTLNAGDGMLTTTDDDGKTTAITGRQDGKDPKNKVGMVYGQAGMQDDPNTAKDEAKTPMASVEAMDVTIGRTLDSRDDMARLMLVTHYAGSKMVKVFDYAEAADAADMAMGPEGSVTHHGTTEEDDPLPLTYKGMYYLATGGTADDNTLVAADSTGTGNSMANLSDKVAGGEMPAKPMRVYSYDKEGTPTYVVVASTNTPAGGKATHTYRQVGITVTLDAVGDATADEISHPEKMVPVMAKLATAKAYDHIHFGVWAGLKEKADGDNSVVGDLGIGFVQSVGDGMTGAGDMPNRLTATYKGDWAAAVQGASAGAIALQHGPATLTANFDKSTLKADLMGLATLSGAIDGSTFSGTQAAVAKGDPHGLTTGGSFDGTFGGGFYGDGAMEAGGVFAFTSDDMADGAFSGAFGGRRPADQ